MPSGAAARVAANLAALRLSDELNRRGAAPSPAEQQVLAAWSGWGAVPEVFDRNNPRFAAQREEIAALLSRDAYRAAEASILNAHYTDPAVLAEVSGGLGEAMVGIDVRSKGFESYAGRSE